jgi:molecular chaperone DnaK
VASARVLRAAEEAKKRLSFEPFAPVQEEFISTANGGGRHLDMEIRREELEEIARPFLDRTLACVGRALEDSRLTPMLLDRVVLVGGSTRIPLVARMLGERLDRPLHQEVDPDLCVALGAALQAGMIGGADVGPVLVDITPHSLGIRCRGEVHDRVTNEMFSPILPRGTALPATRSEVYVTAFHAQRQVRIEVFQGEQPIALHNTRVGDFIVDGLSAVPAGNEVTVTMELSPDGILHVTATEKRTGLNRQVRMEGPVARFDGSAREQAQSRIEGLFGGDDWEPRPDGGDEAAGEAEPALSEVILQARAELERAMRLAPQASPEDRPEIDARAERLRRAIEERDPSAIRRSRDELADLLFFVGESAADAVAD